MRSSWMVIVLVVAACAIPKKPYRPPPPPPPMAVEDVAAWFVRAALQGDESTARTLTLRYDQIATISKKAEPAQWEAAIKDALDALAREGDGEEFVVKANVVERRTLTPAQDEKVLRDVDVAIVKVTVRAASGEEHASGMPWLFIRTDEGWKFSPKQ